MSSELKNILYKRAEDDYKRECKEIEEGLERYKSHLIKIAQAGKWDFPIFIEGWETHREQDERDLNLLERSGLIQSEMKYTERNAYREYRVTKKGAGLVRKLMKEA